MQGMMQELRTSLTWFTQEQREDHAMLVACEDGDIPLVLSALEGSDDADPDRQYLTFAHEARTPRAYVDVMVELLRMRLQVVDAMRKEQGLPCYPPMPPEGLDGEAPADARIRALLTWWRSGLRSRTQVVVVALVPTAIPSPETYQQIVLPLLLSDPTQRWVRYTRLLVRDRRLEPLLAPLVTAQNPDNVVSTTVDFSPEACERGLAADAANPGLDERSRALALLQLAAMDFAQQRHAAAITKYGHLANVFARLGDRSSVALCLVGCADVLRQVERYDEARVRYGQGIEEGTAVGAKPVVLNGLIGLAETTMAMKEYAAAEKAWDCAARVAGAMRMELPVADLVEQVGVARELQSNFTGAWTIWERVLEYLAEPERTTTYRMREVSVLERMVKLSREQRWSSLGEQSRRRLAVAKQQQQMEDGG